MNTAPTPTFTPELAPPTAPAPEVAAVDPARDARLHDLLGVDYEQARGSGLIDMFEYNPATGEDGLMHTLAGDIDTGEGNIAIPGGFHHEESGRLWGVATDEQGNERPITRVDREHLESGNSAHRKKYRERPAEPYLAQVAIGDRPKMEFVKGDNGTELVHAKNAMYPKEYDPMAVMQAVRMARETIDPTTARPGVNHRGEQVVVGEGQAVMIDGATTMPIRLVLNPENGRVKSAYPVIRGKTGLMNLTPEEMWAHATYQTPTSSIRN